LHDNADGLFIYFGRNAALWTILSGFFLLSAAVVLLCCLHEAKTVPPYHLATHSLQQHGWTGMDDREHEAELSGVKINTNPPNSNFNIFFSHT
jgi:hypothetical protein